MSKVTSCGLGGRLLEAAKVVGVMIFLLRIVFSERGGQEVQEARRGITQALDEVENRVREEPTS